jgi:hypothetical protein
MVFDMSMPPMLVTAIESSPVVQLLKAEV